jgi:hypothetical protein
MQPLNARYCRQYENTGGCQTDDSEQSHFQSTFFILKPMNPPPPPNPGFGFSKRVNP